MLISDSMQKVIRYLLNNREEKTTVREIAGATDLSTGITSKNLNRLEDTGYYRRGKVKKWQKLLNAWAYSRTIEEIPTVEFTAAERPQYVMRKLADILPEKDYAFTLYSATEIIAPYVSPDKTSIYIKSGEQEKVEEILKENGFLPAETGNIRLYLADRHHLYSKRSTKHGEVTSLPQLYVDLHSLGGRGVEAAERVLEVMKDV